MREPITDMNILNINGNTIAKLRIHVVTFTKIGKDTFVSATEGLTPCQKVFLINSRVSTKDHYCFHLEVIHSNAGLKAGKYDSDYSWFSSGKRVTSILQ